MTPDPTHHNWLTIRLAPGMTRPRFYRLLDHFHGPDDVLNASPGDIARAAGLDQDQARALLHGHAADAAHRQLDQLHRLGAHIITRHCPEYPDNLRKSALAPPLLFVLGSLNPEDKYSIAMVGSRHATQYGRGVARELSAGLARSGLTIISGFARGVDGEAHHAAIKAGGRTIAVLGNGLDVCYPSQHQSLIPRVTEAGAIITEYPLGTPPERYNFPERNHVIAALSLGTIVVEAAEKSGSLITARLAVEENRFIFAVPGDITRNNSRGANSLIMQGARMVQRPQDVLYEMKDILRGYLNEDLLEEPVEPDPPATPKSPRSKSRVTRPAGTTPENDLSPKTNTTPTAAKPAAAVAAPTLTPDEEFITSLLRHEAMIFDELAQHAQLNGIDVPRLTSTLVKLELRQVIRQLPGRYYVLFT